MKQTETHLEAAFNSMGNEFTTHFLNKAIKTMGGEVPHTYEINSFMKGRAKRLTKYLWRKLEPAEVNLFMEIEEEQAVAILKAKGYKILKPVSDFIEI